MYALSGNISQAIIQGLTIFAAVQGLKDFAPLKAYFDAHDQAALILQAISNFSVAMLGMFHVGHFTGQDVWNAAWVAFGGIAVSKLSHMGWTIAKPQPAVALTGTIPAPPPSSIPAIAPTSATPPPLPTTTHSYSAENDPTAGQASKPIVVIGNRLWQET